MCSSTGLPELLYIKKGDGMDGATESGMAS